jgi:hypothetical protein
LTSYTSIRGVWNEPKIADLGCCYWPLDGTEALLQLDHFVKTIDINLTVQMHVRQLAIDRTAHRALVDSVVTRAECRPFLNLLGVVVG